MEYVPPTTEIDQLPVVLVIVSWLEVYGVEIVAGFTFVKVPEKVGAAEPPPPFSGNQETPLPHPASMSSVIVAMIHFMFDILRC
jgi:hypothetical protein